MNNWTVNKKSQNRPFSGPPILTISFFYINHSSWYFKFFFFYLSYHVGSAELVSFLSVLSLFSNGKFHNQVKNSFLDGRIKTVSKNRWFSNEKFHNQVKNRYLYGRIMIVSKNKWFSNGNFHNQFKNSFSDGRITIVSKKMIQQRKFS